VQPVVQRLRDKPDRLLTILGIASVEDKATQQKASRIGMWAGLCVLATIGSFVGTILTGGLLLPVTLGFLALTIVLIVRYKRRKRLDLDDRKLDTALKLLRILRADIPKDASVALTLDPRMYSDGGTVVSRKGSITKYRHPWLELTAPLADGNVVTLGLTDRVKRKDKTKRKKSIHLEWWRSDLDVTLKLAKRYGDASSAAQRLRARAAPPTLKLVTVAEQGARAGRARTDH
jgi:hypothetical protein